MAYGREFSLRRQGAEYGKEDLYNRHGELIRSIRPEKKSESSSGPKKVSKAIGVVSGGAKGAVAGKQVGTALTPLVAAIPGAGPALAPFVVPAATAIGTGIGAYANSEGGSSEDLEEIPDDIKKIRSLYAKNYKSRQNEDS